MRRLALGLSATLVTLSVASCGAEAPSPVAIPSDALPGRAGRAVELDAAALAAETTDGDRLGTLLDDAGFVGGTERAFSRTEGGRRRALARVLVFESPGGADRYLAWLEEHVDELIGGATPVAAVDPPLHLLVVHDADACCPRDSTVYLAAWRKGGVVLTLELGGQGVEANDVSELAATLDAAV